MIRAQRVNFGTCVKHAVLIIEQFKDSKSLLVINLLGNILSKFPIFNVRSEHRKIICHSPFQIRLQFLSRTKNCVGFPCLDIISNVIRYAVCCSIVLPSTSL